MSEIEVFQFPATGQRVRTVIIEGQPWFVLRDVLQVLGLTNPTEVVRSLDEDEFRTTEVVDSAGRRQPNTYGVNEPEAHRRLRPVRALDIEQMAGRLVEAVTDRNHATHLYGFGTPEYESARRLARWRRAALTRLAEALERQAGGRS